MSNLKQMMLIVALALPICTQSGWAQEKKSNQQESQEKKIMKTGSENFIFGNETAWEPAGEGITRQIMGYDGQIMMVKVKFEKGAVGAMHSHYHSQATYVESGKFEFTVNGVTKIVVAGDALYKEPDAVHGCVCLEPGVLIDCFTPMRAEFLKK